MLEGLIGNMPLDSARRLALLEISEARAQYFLVLGQYNNLLAAAYRSGDEGHLREAQQFYVDMAIDSKKAEIDEKSRRLLANVVDIDKLKSMLPIAGLGLLQGVDLDTLFTAIGTSPRQIDRIAEHLRDLFK